MADEMTIAEHLESLRISAKMFPSREMSKDIDAIEAHMGKREKVIEAIVKFLSEQIGDCPTSFFGYAKDKKCEVCIGDIPLMMECWKEYFKKQVGETDGKTD